MATFYNLIIIGSGTAASTVADQIHAAGWRVAMVDCRPYGGTCMLRGCDPKKILVSAARAVDGVRRRARTGVQADPRLDWAGLMDYKRKFTDPIPERRLHALAQQDIDTFRGRARFTSPNTIRVGEHDLESEYILLATGAQPVSLDIPGAEHLVTSDEFLDLQSLPRRILFVGGGYIAAEFSHLAAQAGAQVTVVQRGERILKHFEPELVDWLRESFQARGIDVQTQTRVTGVEKAGQGFRVSIAAGRLTDTLEADLVVHAAGRAPQLDDLDLEAGEVETDDGRLLLNEFLQSSSNEAVFAAGDAAQLGPPLTPVAAHDGRVVAANMLMGTHRKPDYRGVPSVAFSIPPIAAVGLSENQARLESRSIQVRCRKTSGWFRAYESAETTAGYKIILDESGRHVLGAHLLGSGVDEVINLFALAIRHRLTVDQLKNTVFAYPTGASDLGAMLS